MSSQRQVYLLDPKEYSPETIAVAFAKTSRSPESFRDIAAGLSAESSAQFHERWVVGYGHASVAEHAVLHLAVENLSRLAIECLESNRLASYTEKSTRYQTWNPDSYYTPEAIAASRWADVYQAAGRRLFDTYGRSLEPLRRLAQAQHPRRANESDAAWDSRIRSKYVDNARYLLPASSLANVGLTANARVLEGAIRKLLSHPLAEVRAVGEEIKQVARAETPTLVKYAEAAPYQMESAARLSRLSPAGPALAEQAPEARLVDFDSAAEARFLAACLYRYGGADYSDCLAVVAGMTPEQKQALAQAALGGLGPHDVPLRELEHVSYTFDVLLDQGAYFELKRHRLMTQSPQRLTASLGYVVPRAWVEAGLEADYRGAMDQAAEAYAALAAELPEEAGYVVANGFKRRVLMTLNLRQAFHLCELRGSPGAHFAVRVTAGQMFEAIAGVHPLLAQFMRCRANPNWRQIAAQFLG